jgi:glyoxylase-like metal-dependent hydrolase (beta-lactamase superfamily II)
VTDARAPRVRETVLLHGVPASSPRGFLGWSTSLLLEAAGARIVIDCGGNGDRHVLQRRLDELAIDPASVDALILTHLHFDHCLNLDLFPRARIVVSARELAYVESGEYRARADPGIPPYVLSLLAGRDVRAVLGGAAEAGVEERAAVPGVRLLATPGHTPGSLSVLYDTEGGRSAACADLVKNAREFLLGPATTEGQRSLAALRARAERFVPGHDRPFRATTSGIAYEGVLSLEISVISDPRADAAPTRWVLD